MSNIITMTTFGDNGRLGNQMFQYAAMLGISMIRGYDLVLPDNNAEIYDVFPKTRRFINEEMAHAPLVYAEPSFSYNPSAFHAGPGDYFGYFQSPYYFEDEIVDDQVIADFEIERRPHDGVLVGIHVRRGDYLGKEQWHPVQHIEYYQRGIEYIRGRIGDDFDVMIVSDDPTWCREYLVSRLEVPGAIYVYEGLDSKDDFMALANCDHHIIANSSFSWWAAFLANTYQQIVVCPAEWFGPAYPLHSTEDLIPRWWVRL